MGSNDVGNGVGGATGVFGVDKNSESEIPVLAPAEPRRERLLLLFGDRAIGDSSPPLCCSPSASLILSPSRINIIRLATNRSPPDTVLFLPSLSKRGGVGDGEGNE